MSTHFIATLLGSLHQSRLVQAALLTANFALSTALLTPPSLAGQVPSGKTAFTYASTFAQAPQLVSASTNQLAAFVSGGTYEFTLTVPSNAGAPLQAVTISQESNPSKIGFAVNQSRAIANGAPVSLASIGGNGSDDIAIAFAQPIQPGTTVTISLQAEQSPGAGGVYLFGITAYPVGEQAMGLFLGYGRVTLFSNGG